MSATAADEFVEALNRQLSIRAAVSGDIPEVFGGGWWDGATLACPDAFFELNFNGRP